MRASKHPPKELPVDGEELLGVVRGAAGRLVADLERARALTGEWSDRALTDALVEAALSRLLEALAATGCRGEGNRLPSGELWRIAGPLLETGSLQVRARFKPRGYAGDYELLERIWADDDCDDPLGFAFDRFFQRQAAPQAVRARTRRIAATLASECLEAVPRAYRVVSVGCGPATDIARGVGVLPEDRRQQLTVVLLDMDPDALEFARGPLEPLLPAGALVCVRENLARLASRPEAAQAMAGADLLVCSGLFDYLADAAAAEMLGLFWRQLAEGGLMLVGNFAPHNPTRAYMEWIDNWYLIYRTAQELAGLAAAGGIPAAARWVAAESSGVDLFLCARRQRS